jgi:hypothetical protein
MTDGLKGFCATNRLRYWQVRDRNGVGGSDFAQDADLLNLQVAKMAHVSIRTNALAIAVPWAIERRVGVNNGRQRSNRNGDVAGFSRKYPGQK